MLTGKRDIPAIPSDSARAAAWAGSIEQATQHAAWILGIAAWLVCVWTTAATGETEESGEPAWIPGVNVGVELYNMRFEQNVQNLVTGPMWDGAGDSSIRQYFITFGGELASPSVEAVPGRPRLVVGGGIGIPVASPDTLFSIGEPASVTNPEQDITAYNNALATQIRRGCVVNNTCRAPEVEGFRGQGSDLRASLDNVTWHGDIGVRFEIPLIDDMVLEIQPSASYRGERIKFQGRLTTLTLDQFIPADPPTVDITTYRSRPGAKNEVAHHVGPRLEIALLLSRRARPIRSTLFAHASYLWILTDRTTRLMDASGIARYSAHREAGHLRGGLGVRFSWVGWQR